MAPRSVIRGFEDVHELFEVGVVSAELPVRLAKLIKLERRHVFFVWVAKIAVEGCGEGGKRVESYLICFFTVHWIRSPAEVDPHRSLRLTCYELVCVAQLVLGVREAGGVTGGFLHELVLEKLQFFSGSVKSVRIGDFLGSGCGLENRGRLGGAGKAVHDHFSIGQPLLESAFPSHVLLALRSSLVALCSEAGDKLIGGQAT